MDANTGLLGPLIALDDADPNHGYQPTPKRRCPTQVVKDDPNLKPAIIRVKAPEFVREFLKAVAEKKFDFDGVAFQELQRVLGITLKKNTS